MLQFSAEEAFTKYEMCGVFAEILGVGMGGIRPDARGSGKPELYDCHLSTAELKALDIPVDAQTFRGWWRWELRAFRK